MDIKRPKKNTHTKKIILATLGAGIILAGYLLMGTMQPGQYVVKKTHIRTATAQQGSLVLTVRAPGSLISTDIRWLATQVEGTVEQVLVKPGSLVEQGQTLVVLSNPKLQQSLDELGWDLESMQAQNQAEIKQLESQALDQKSTVAKAKADFQTAAMEYRAETALREKNLGSISQIAYESIRLKKEQAEQRWHIEQERKVNLASNIKAQTHAKNANLKKLQQQIIQAKAQVEALKVKAKITAMVQEVPIQSGQQLSLGANAAKLAKQNDLIAQLNVPELQIHGVKIGQPVEVDTRDHILAGTVTRVSPSIINGTVEVDVTFTNKPPETLRPDLSVEGEITIQKIDNATYVQRPVYSQSHRTLPVFKIDETQTYAERIMVEFGAGSTHEIQVLAGLKPGDSIITSAPDQLEDYQSIRIKN